MSPDLSAIAVLRAKAAGDSVVPMCPGVRRRVSGVGSTGCSSLVLV